MDWTTPHGVDAIMGIYDGILGRFYSAGTVLDLGVGVDIKSGLVATYNTGTHRIDISVDTSESGRAITIADPTAAATEAAEIGALHGHVVLAPLGTGADDWARLRAVLVACAYKYPVHLAEGEWICDSVQLIPSGTTLIGSPGVRIIQSLDLATGNPLIAAFAASESAGTFSTTLRADAVIGSRTLDLTSVTGLNVGDVIKVIETTYRAVMFEVKAITVSAPHNYVTVDRPIRNALANGDALATIEPARNITIRGNGMQIAGVGSRYIELINCWQGLVQDVVFDTSSGIPDERFVSIDMCCINVRAERLRGDGLGTLPIGVSFESTSDGCAFVDCEISRCVVGYAVQDAMSATLRDCRAIGCGVGCELFGSDAGAGLGAQDCRIDGGSYNNSTTHGISIKDGSRRNVISRVSCVGNGNDGIVFSGASAMTANVIESCICTNNTSSGVDVAAGAVGTKIIGTDCSSCGCAFTVLAPATQTIMLNCSGALSNGLINLSTDLDVTGFTGSVPANAGPGITIQSGAKFVGRGLNLSSPDASAGGTPVKLVSMSNATCSCVIDGALLTLGTNDWGLVPAFAGNTMRIKNVVINKAGGATGTYGIFQLGGTLYLEGTNVDNSDNAWTLVNATRGTAAPSAGTWVVGDICWRVPYVSGQPINWACTVAGTPGTWVAGPNAA